MSSDSTELATRDAFDDAEEAPEGDRSRMSFLEHLDELRRRIIYSLYGILAGCSVSFWFLNDLYEAMTKYLSLIHI